MTKAKITVVKRKRKAKVAVEVPPAKLPTLLERLTAWLK